MSSREEREERKFARASRVKNKHAAPVQITAEQILREAQERQIEYKPPPPKQHISDPEELAAVRLKKRRGFEDEIRKNRDNITNWIRYGVWESEQSEMDRARSVFERALDISHRNPGLWLKYAEIEMKNRQVNHARNILDRAVLILPRVNQLWYRYVYMEEKLKNIAGCRQVFERWMHWHPDEQAWHAYINMEMRYSQIENARQIYERYVMEHIDAKHWIKYAKFEIHNGEPERARRVFERAVEFFGDDHLEESLFVAFARFEESQKEYDRARFIFKYALEKIPKEQAKDLFSSYTQFEKKYGEAGGVETVIMNKRKFQYQQEVQKNPLNYDAWFDYVKLCEASGNIEETRDVYEQAIANVPPAREKRLWRRYIYLWIYYAVFEELDAKDLPRTRAVYKACLDLIPHKQFTFAKIWLLAAQFEVRQRDLKAARLILGTAIGKCPKPKLFKGYIELELQLREFDRCRALYNKFLEYDPVICDTWIKYAELEAILGEMKRARALFELAIRQDELDMPELLWKSYIDFENELGNYDRVRDLYERLLEKTSHVKVWVSYAQFEAALPGSEAIAQARHVFELGDAEVKKSDEKAQRKVLLDAWLAFEKKHGDDGSQEKVRKLMPRRVKKRRAIVGEDGANEGIEEYWDYEYPDDKQAQPAMNLLARAHEWKQKMAQQEGNNDE